MELSKDWERAFTEVLHSEDFLNLKKKVEEEYKGHKICPPRDKIFNAFNLCPQEEVKVVILGQDPYFNPGQANGIAFSINPTCKLFPPTLRNIIKEVRASQGVCTVEDGDLTPWVGQGVLLLNTCLTVREGQPLSHANIGWGSFIDAALKKLNEKNDIVFVLWGNNAKKYLPLLTNSRNLVLTSSHPSPLSAHYGFLGCGHFRKINEFLTARGKKPIVF